MEVHPMRLEHGPMQTASMPYAQRQTPNHRTGSGGVPGHPSAEAYKPARSPLPNAATAPPHRAPLPVAPQSVAQLQVPQRYASQVQAAAAAPAPVQQRPDYRQGRITLLHPADFGAAAAAAAAAASGGRGGCPSQQALSLGDSGSGQQPPKKIRLQDGRDGFLPLRIDTRPPGAYNPQVEAISPTFPEDQAFKTTKDELIQQIGRVDREIAKVEAQIVTWKKEQAELEEVAGRPRGAKEAVEEDKKQKHQSYPQKIYAENRKKAQQAHAQLESLGPKVDWPLYNQPGDTQVYHKNKRKHACFKRRLLEYFKKRHSEVQARNNHLTDTYSKLMQEWMRKVEKVESSTKRKVKEAKNREFFEKVFPELRKQREDKERFNRVGARVKSEADMEEIMDNLQEQAQEDKKMRSYAVIPPILSDVKDRKIRYQDNNGFVEDMEAVYKSRQFLNIWTPSEKEIFKEKYLQHPKNFGVIASYLDRKSVADCVQYYYLSKKTENYKRLLRKSRQRTRSARNNTQKVNSSANTSVVYIITTGVTTRLQREQQQRTVQQPRADATAASSETATSSTPPPTTTTATTTVASPTSVVSTATTAASSTASPGATATATAASTSAATAPPTSVAASVISSTAATSAASGGEDQSDKPKFSDFNSFEDYNRMYEEKSKEGGVILDGSKQQSGGVAAEGVVVNKEVDGIAESASDQNMSASNAPVSESKKKKERRKDKENTAVETSDEESSSIQDKGAQGACAVCGSQLGPALASRPLHPSQAAHYDLREEQVATGARVCSTCRCKWLRTRSTHCPLPGCPNARGRVKRLRSFPHRFQELPADAREPLIAEFRIPSGVTKCCSACFNRIQRRLGPAEEWPEEDVSQLKTALTELGANWQLIGERLGKPPPQVRSFYAVNRKRLGLEGCLGDRKPALTDEEESGSSTSSCEEPHRERHSSDTASAAESPPVLQPSQNPVKKEDYDSSATETADEAQTPDHYQTTTVTPVANDCQPRQNQSPISVKDLVLNVIEISLMKNSGGQQLQQNPTSGMTPTISSILNNDPSEVTIVSEYSLNNIGNQQRTQQQQQRNDMSLAKLVTPLIAATITPVTGPIQPQTQPEPARDDLVVVQVQDNRGEPETLDLSLKKPRELLPPQPHAKMQQQIHRSEPQYIYHQERSPAFIRQQPKLPSPKPANPSKGSITQGTPVFNQQRYEGLLRQIPDAAKMGSITQGTPIHLPHNMQEKRVYDYFSKQPGRIPQQPPQMTGQYRQTHTSYLPDQQLNSRQIIINDYITSQQMLGRRPEKPQYFTTNSPHRTPPPPQQNQQRQGVIQRHTRPQYLPPGHEALSSLVDVAVQQPSLPVPSAPHEGLGKTMADNIMEQPHRFQMIQQHQQQMRHQQRMEEHRRAYQQQQVQAQAQQQAQAGVRQAGRSDSSITAASLIDAIITHQINQTAEGGREVVATTREPPRAGDLLFQGFHRDGPSQDNGERPPSVISVDLDGDGVNKNLTVKELTDSVISHDFNTRPGSYYHLQDNVNEQWKRRLQAKEENAKRAATPQQQDERQIIRIAQPQKYHVEPVSPPESNHWATEQNFRRYQQPQSHMSPLDYVNNKIAEVMRTEGDKKDCPEAEKERRSASPGEMVIDEEKHENTEYQREQQQSYSYAYKESESSRSNEPKPLLSAQYEPLSDED